MKPGFRLLTICLLFAACSSNKEAVVGPVSPFTFTVTGANEKTTADSLNAMIGRAFLERYALIDTSMIATGNVIAANILAYDPDSERTKCVAGYAIFVKEEPKPDPTFEGDYYGSPSKVYFFTGNNYHYEVWNNPIVTPGSSEDATEEARIDLQYVVSGKCSLFGLRINSPVQVAGVMTDEGITLYYWSEEEHKLVPAGKFETGYSRMGAEHELRSGSIQVSNAGAEGSKLVDLLYTMTGDSSFTDRYSWQNGKYVKQGRVMSSAVVKNLEHDPYKQFAFDARDTAALHVAFVDAFESVDPSMEVSNHSMKAVKLVRQGGDGGCVSGYLITIVEREDAGSKYGDVYGGIYFIPDGSDHYEEGNYDYTPAASKVDSYNRTDITTDLIYAIDDGCPVLSVETDVTGGTVQNREQELFVWSAGGIVSVGKFTMHHLSLVQAETQITDGRLEIVSNGGARQLNHIFTKDGVESSQIYKWDGKKFSGVTN